MAITEYYTPPAAALPIWYSSFTVTDGHASSIELDLIEPMVVSFGTFTSRPSGWLSLECTVNDVPATGFGEGATLPKAVFTDDSGENIAANLQELTEVLKATPRQTVDDAVKSIRQYEFADGKHYPTARLAVEMAILDAATKAHKTSVKELIGVAAEIVDVPYGKSIGGSDTESIVRQAEEALAQNAKKIKVKVSPSLFADVKAAVQTIRQEYPEIDIMVDANGGFDPHDPTHLAMISELDELGLIMFEEPVSRAGETKGLDAVRYMRQMLPDLKTPICLDDCLKTIDDCKTALDEGLAEIINVKPGRIGSFLLSLDLVELATDHFAQVMVGGMLEGTPGRCMTTLLGAYCMDRGFTVPGDLSLAQERVATDLVTTDKQLRLSKRGAILLPHGLGWGF